MECTPFCAWRILVQLCDAHAKCSPQYPVGIATSQIHPGRLPSNLEAHASAVLKSSDSCPNNIIISVLYAHNEKEQAGASTHACTGLRLAGTASCTTSISSSLLSLAPSAITATGLAAGSASVCVCVCVCVCVSVCVCVRVPAAQGAHVHVKSYAFCGVCVNIAR